MLFSSIHNNSKMVRDGTWFLRYSCVSWAVLSPIFVWQIMLKSPVYVYETYTFVCNLKFLTLKNWSVVVAEIFSTFEENHIFHTDITNYLIPLWALLFSLREPGTPIYSYSIHTQKYIYTLSSFVYINLITWSCNLCSDACPDI